MKKVSEKLINYIKKYNADARKYNDEKKGTGSFMGLMIEDASHWAGYGVYSLRDYVKFDLQIYIWDEYKSVHGIRPRFMDFKNMGIRELRRQVNLLNK